MISDFFGSKDLVTSVVGTVIVTKDISLHIDFVAKDDDAAKEVKGRLEGATIWLLNSHVQAPESAKTLRVTVEKNAVTFKVRLVGELYWLAPNRLN